MAPITKEPETLSSAQSSTGTIPPAGTKSQPAAAEIPVTVNGARSVEGTDRREPFSEKTQTVLVFANGGVIRLSSPVSSGQLLFLTNEKSRKEVVCQVVKSKNYSSVSGYVELEFTEASPGFWGMRFPSSEGAASVSNVAKPLITIPTPALKPVEDATAKTNTTKPPAPVSGNPIPSLVAETARPRAAQLARQSAIIPAHSPMDSKPAVVANEECLSAVPNIPTLSEFLTHGESGPELKNPERVKPVTQNVRQAQAKDETTQAIAPASKIAAPAKAARDEEKKESLTSLLVPAPVREDPAPGTYTFDFAADEVKIPAWLEPLARNSSIISAPPETKMPVTHESDVKALEPNSVLTEPAETVTSNADSNEHQRLESLSPKAAEQDSDSNREAVFTLSGDGPAPNFGSGLALDAKSGEAEGSSQGSGAGLKFGLLAAGLLLAAGGGWYWYSNQPRSVAANGTAAAPAISGTTAANTPSLPTPNGLSSNVTSSQPGKPNPSSDAANVDANRSATNPQTIRTDNKGFATTSNGLSKPAGTNDRVETLSAPTRKSLAEPEKKPTLGQVRLAAPVVGRRDLASDNNNVVDAAPALGGGGVTAGDSGSVNILASKSNQPAAPITIGGDVKPARLVSSVAPAYPQMARNQHVSGDVKIDALIDANGHVSGMKIISGPALLHQAAQDAVRQWKYQPATLNGQPMPMHLIVTVQFKLQ
jgi:TonB family protein